MKITSKQLSKIILTALLALSGAWQFAGAAEMPVYPESKQAFAPISARSEAAWQRHLDSLAGQTIQPACRPYRLAAQGRRRGSVVLLHGFSACPQQYWDIAPDLAAQGFDVFAPLMPGHGRVWSEQGPQARIPRLDDIAGVPSDADYGNYRELALLAADLVRDDSGRRQVIGLSVGGLVAAAALTVPGAFDRGLLVTPLFDITAPYNWQLPLLSGLGGATRSEWGPGCEVERGRGRGGYCQFTLGQLRASQRFGNETLAGLADVTATVQLAGVEGDGNANSDSIASAARRLPFASACLYRRGANHSLFSRFDAPDEDKFWLPAFKRQLLRFTGDGRFFDQEQPPGLALEAGLPRCRID